MPQPKKGARLGGSASHQKLILANLATSLFEPQVADMDPGERESLARAVPVRRFGRPTEAAHAVKGKAIHV